MSLLRRLCNKPVVIKFTTFAKQMSTITFLSHVEAGNLAQDHFTENRVDQLMESAGLSVATCVCESYPLKTLRSGYILICCGPDIHGAIGLVAARNLKLLLRTAITRSLESRKFINGLLKLCMDFNIKLIDTVNAIGDYPIIVDAVFGFSYKPPEFKALLEAMASVSNATLKMVNVDVPSGWNVKTGSQSDTPVINANLLDIFDCTKIMCDEYFKGSFHWLSNGFVPPSIMKKYNLTNLPELPFRIMRLPI